MSPIRKKIRGQGMTEYIIIVALIAVGAIGVYSAFGNIVRGQTGRAASALAGAESGGAKQTVTAGQQQSNANAQGKRGLDNYDDNK
jgi:type IV pilus assembly protein PilA